jgi:hypothetical protein
VLMGQGKPMFLDLTPTKKAELFSDVLGLDVWLERSKKAAAKAQEQDVVSRELERKLADVEGQLRSIDHSALEGSASEWKADNARRLRVVEDRYAAALDDRKAKKEKLTAATEKLETTRDCLKTAVANEDKTRRVLSKATEDCREAQSRARDAERVLQDKDKDRLRLLALDDCPTCRQSVPVAHREHIDRQIQRDMAALAKEEHTHWRHAEGAAASEAEARTRVDHTAAGVAEWHKAVRDAERDEVTLRNDIAYIDKDLDRLEDEAERITSERNPFASMRQEALDREENLQARRLDLQRRLDASVSRHYLLTFWVKGFKEMRLQLINESLQQLEIEVNSNVAELGLHGWELRFEVDKENKGGGITKGFNVRVLSPHNEKSVPWESWSGGEGQRLRVAAQEGLADLIRTRTGCSMQLEVWDEPTEHLSGQGVSDLLDSLATRARREQRQIWVVDHRALGYANFTDVYTVVKDDNGSRIEH